MKEYYTIARKYSLKNGNMMIHPTIYSEKIVDGTYFLCLRRVNNYFIPNTSKKFPFIPSETEWNILWENAEKLNTEYDNFQLILNRKLISIEIILKMLKKDAQTFNGNIYNYYYNIIAQRYSQDFEVNTFLKMIRDHFNSYLKISDVLDQIRHHN